MAKKDDFYITTLKYARQKTVEGEPVEGLATLAHVRGIHPAITDQAIQRVYQQSVEASGRGSFMSLDAYFKLLEHEELHEARQSSSKALIVAIAAFLVSSAAVITSVFVQSGA